MSAHTCLAEQEPLVSVSVAHASFSVLWREMRAFCDRSLSQNAVVVVLLRNAAAFAEDGLLGEDDCRRAARFHRAVDRNHFVLGRTAVHHLVRPPHASTPYMLSFGKYGKPFLVDAPFFNLSHSGEWMACAVCQSEPVGVDVEAFTHLHDYRDLLPSITHPAERLCMDQATAIDRMTLFKRCWTRKEAVLKASGEGLGDNLKKLNVELDLAQPSMANPPGTRLIDLPVQEEQVFASLAFSTSIKNVNVAIVE